MSDILWRNAALCRGEDPELWFPVGRSTNSPAMAQVEEAKAVCRGCPVRRECAEYAYNAGQTAGIWAGHDLERRAGRDDLVEFVTGKRPTRYKPARGDERLICEGCGQEFERPPTVHRTTCKNCWLGLVDSGPAREWIHKLLRWGRTREQIATLAGVRDETIRRIDLGRQPEIKATTAARIRAVPLPESVRA